MTHTDRAGRVPPVRRGELERHESEALARLADRYAGDLPDIHARGRTLVSAVVHAVVRYQAGHLMATSDLFAEEAGLDD